MEATRSEAVAALYRSHYSRILTLCLAETGCMESAEDLAQDTFARVLAGHTRPNARLLDCALKHALIDKSERDEMRDKWTPSDTIAKAAYWQAAYGEDLTPMASQV